jgi:hypothetical protein
MKPLVLLCLLLTAATTHAGMYRWVDEFGVTHYSQTPPPDQDADKIAPPPPPAVDPEEARRRLDKQLQAVDDRREDRELAAEEKRRQKEALQIDQQNCANARANMEKLERSSNRLVKSPDGTYTRFSEEQRQQHIEKARTIIDKHCK